MYKSITLSESDVARFWRTVKIENPDECWEWKGSPHLSGYGEFGQGKYEKLRPNRVSWTIHFGPIPDNLLICHTCDNRKCVNPNHLFPGTHKDNGEDMARKKRGRKTGNRGEEHGRAKLKMADVAEIRKLLTTGVRVVEIAREYEVSWSTVKSIEQGRSWSWMK